MITRLMQSFLLCAVLAVPVGYAQTPAPAVPAGAVFHFVGMIYLAGRIEFRDASGELWPNYWYEAKFGDVRGQFVFDQKNPRLSFILNCARLTQDADGHELKILGETMADGQIPTARFTVHKIGAWQPAAAEAKIGACEVAPIEGELVVGNRKVPVKTTARITYTLPKGKTDMGGLAASSLLGMSINLQVGFTIKGRDLGLKKVANKDINVSIHSRAFTEETILTGTKKKTLQEAGVRPLDEPAPPTK